MLALLFRSGLLVLSFCWVFEAGAEGQGVLLYRYIDSRGQTVIDRQGVPPDYIGKGYDVLNEHGRVVQSVGPAPTAAELQRRQAEQQQASENAQLLRRYSSLADLDRASARRQAEFSSRMSSLQSSLQALLARQADLQGRAAAQERAGREVSEPLLDELADAREQQARMSASMAAYQAEQAQAEQAFAADRVRLQQLLPAL